ncbi:MAG: hypothetical protein JXA33_24430 [Anaerolineae bacterium]|nr:hypothetical protein [Anaerolineae bacterium]
MTKRKTTHLSNFWIWFKSEIFILLLFAVLTVCVTYPVITQLNTHLVQNPDWGTDAFHHTYVLWWFKQALFTLKTSPANLLWIQFPHGGYYPMLNTFAAVYLPGVPLLFFLPPATVYNVLFLMSLFLSGFFGYLLCAYLTQNRLGGILGGIIYAFFPSHMAHAYSGHLELMSIYAFPLFLLFMIKTFRQPRWPSAIACGVTLAISMLIQPMFLPFLLIPITLIWLMYETLALKRPCNRATVVKLGSAFSLAILLVLPFYLPVLYQQAEGQSTYLQDIGIVVFSSDLLGTVSPSPLNPILTKLGLIPNYARDAVPLNFRFAELFNYAGIIPLTLAALAFITQRRETSSWALLALGAALLALGPVLKIAGEMFTFTADDVTSTLALPYATLMNLPFLSYNRAPARLNTTLMLCIAVLAAYGIAWLSTRLRSHWRYICGAGLCILTLIEFIAVWPARTTPLVTPEGFTTLAQTPDNAPVFSVPLSEWHTRELSLYYQTLHQHPIFDGWVQRSLPRAEPVADECLDALLRPMPETDIIPTASPTARAAIAQAESVGYVALFTRYVNNTTTYNNLFAEAFGQPLGASDGISVYRVPTEPLPLDDLTYILPEERWSDVETWDGHPARWIYEFAELYLYSPETQSGALHFTALPLNTVQQLEIEVNDVPISGILIGGPITYTTGLITLNAGHNLIRFRPTSGCEIVHGDPRCMGIARTAGAECNPYTHKARCLSILFQDVRFERAETAPGMYPVDVTLDDGVALLGYDLRGNAEPGKRIDVVLYWQAYAPITHDYIIFVHLLGPDGTLVSQFDAPPLEKLHLTTSWKKGIIFTHVATLEIPVDTAPGEYQVLTGMYTYPDLQRLTVMAERPFAEHNLVWLQNVTLKPDNE